MALPEYNETERREAVRAYIMYGTYKEAERVTGIPWETMAGWKHRDPEWWDRAVHDITLKSLEDLTDPDFHALKRIRSNIIKKLEERIQDGDQKLNMKTGLIEKIPIAAKDLAQILPILGGAMESEPVKDDPAAQAEARNEEFSRIAREEREARAAN